MSRLLTDLPPAALLLEDGNVFYGYSFGAEVSGGFKLGEVVFNTAMSGYQEILTDPSYSQQHVVMTYPEIGNYGINEEDMESKKAWLSGLIVHNYSEIASNWRKSKTLQTYLQEQGIPALCGVDTRAVTTHIRSKGAMNAYILCPAPHTPEQREEFLQKLKKEPRFGLTDLVAQVSSESKYDWDDASGEWHRRWPKDEGVEDATGKTVVVMDFGVKYNILRNLKMRGCKVHVVPVGESAEKIDALKPDGIFLSNGPGDPEVVENAADTVKHFLGRVPVFGICMGHQILGRALGARNFKMKFGHHGANQPVYEKRTGRVIITSQNHGYAMDPESLPKDVEVTYTNLNDQSVEGIYVPGMKAASVQFHPEASPGPHDASGFFDDFVRVMNGKEMAQA